MGKPRRLPVVTYNGRKYFEDDRLQEYRTVDPPLEFIPYMSDLGREIACEVETINSVFFGNSGVPLPESLIRGAFRPEYEYEIFWSNGSSEIIIGENFLDAMKKKGYLLPEILGLMVGMKPLSYF